MTERPLVTSEDFDRFAPEWAGLLEAVPGASPFLHPAWHAVWLRHFGAEASPVFLSVRREERLIGAMAFDMRPGRAMDLGDHNVRDYGGPLALPGEEHAVAEGVLEWLREDLTGSAEFRGIPTGSTMSVALADAADSGGWRNEREHEAVCPGVDLPETFEEYVAALSKKDRHELRRKMRNFEAAGMVEFETRTEGGDAVADLLRLMRASREDKDEFLTVAMEAFFHDVADTFAQLGMLRIGRLSLDGHLVASTFAFDTCGVTYLWNSGYDPEFTHLSVGLVSKAHAIETAIRAGQRRFDFLRGDEDYKRRLGGEPRALERMLLGP